MWIITDVEGMPVGEVKPSKGNNNLVYQLRGIGLIAQGDQFVGVGTFRQIKDASGNLKYNVVKMPYIPVSMRNKPRGVLYKAVDVTPGNADTSSTKEA
jgi:hypothetical protein